ncbi:MAG: SDR family NAD(P)-dependent oxidoreductase [Paracoccus sp. BP8]|uniref:oxidoreductase n=1 Tax=Paracoccus sp. J39 TaxID=935848 RepID=UPI000491372A|nr:oxidoreductase [Paracoccus sp. J39]RQP08150.1 MAG: SDR family NAD(P)-dependent oxidoreductase [Paracoccus sp. BP8]
MKTWLITGADKGLGYETAKTALERGDNVIVTVLNKDGRSALVERFPDHARAYHLNAADHARFPEVVAQAEADFGGIDVLVNNAGYGLTSVAEETPPEKYRPLFEVNFFGTTEMIRAVLPGMRKRSSGHILNFSSTAGFGAAPGFSFYSAAKFAVEGYSESLAREVGPLGIKVTIVEPGPFRSDFAGGSLDSKLSDIPDYKDLGDWISSYSSSRHGTQPNDPARIGPALCRIVDAEDPPLRLPLGVDALAHLRAECAQVLEEIAKWEDVSRSTTVSV